MGLKDIFRRKPQESTLPLFDDAFLRRLERLSFRTVPSLRGAMWGERRSRNTRPTFDFSDHRPYAGGDDLRHVDWNVYGRHDELFVKLGEATQSVTVHILLDKSRSMAWVPGRNLRTGRLRSSRKWDGARRLAGALGYLGLAGGERLMITPFGHALEESFGPTRGKRQIIPALHFLSALVPAPEINGGAVQTELTRGLSDYAQANAQGGVLVLISDLFDEPGGRVQSSIPQGYGERLARGLRHLTLPRWQVLVVHLLTEQEVHPTLEGDYDLRDVESGEHLPFYLDERTLSQYRSRVEAWCAELESTCARWGATYTRILAEWPIERAVIPYLRERGVVQ